MYVVIPQKRDMGPPARRRLAAAAAVLLMVLLCTPALAAPNPDKLKFNFGGPGGALAALGKPRLERIRRINGQQDKTLDEVARMLEGDPDLVSLDAKRNDDGP
jgi:hypothetical protein